MKSLPGPEDRRRRKTGKKIKGKGTKTNTAPRSLQPPHTTLLSHPSLRRGIEKKRRKGNLERKKGGENLHLNAI